MHNKHRVPRNSQVSVRAGAAGGTRLIQRVQGSGTGTESSLAWNARTQSCGSQRHLDKMMRASGSRRRQLSNRQQFTEENPRQATLLGGDAMDRFCGEVL
jgi:hypothetical protein